MSSIRQVGLETVSEPTKTGRMVLENWKRLESVYPNIKTDYFCLMPNHLHGIIIIDNSPGFKPIPLSQILRGFKSVTTREYNKFVAESEKNTLWQSSFFDEIIRDDEMLRNIRNYISGNPSKWLDDPMYTI